MTVDNRNQDDEDGSSGQGLQRQNSKGDMKDSDAMNLQATPIEKVKLKMRHAIATFSPTTLACSLQNCKILFKLTLNLIAVDKNEMG
jgi:hypothetical protein